MLRFTYDDYQPTRLSPIYKYRTYPLLSLRRALKPILFQIHQLNEYIKIAERQCHYPSEHDLDLNESACIYLYTMDWGEESLYRVFNRALRAEDQLAIEPWYDYIKLFDTALRKLPNLRRSLWRGVDQDISGNYREGVSVTWWSFSSCSTSESRIEQFLGSVSTLFMIDAKNGKDISAYSSLPNEKEVILGLGTRLKPVSASLNRPPLNIVQLVELSDEYNKERSILFSSEYSTSPVRSVDGRLFSFKRLVVDHY